MFNKLIQNIRVNKEAKKIETAKFKTEITNKEIRQKLISIGYSRKDIYRIIHSKHSPSLGTFKSYIIAELEALRLIMYS